MRIAISIKAKLFEFDEEAFKSARAEAVRIHIRQCARAFVRAAITKIPVQTGMAKGSFLNIGRFLKVNIPLNGKSSKRQRYRKGRTWTEKNIWYYPPTGSRLPKTPESGANLTAFSFPAASGKFGFIINSKVFHYTLQDEFGGRSPSSPWESMRAGREAWREEMKKIKKRLPKITDYLLESTISLGAGAGGLTITKGRLRIRTVDRG